MFEWQNVQTIDFLNTDGNITRVKLIHESVAPTKTRLHTITGEDLDLIAYIELGTELNALKLLEANPLIAEYDFNLSNLSQINIPL